MMTDIPEDDDNGLNTIGPADLGGDPKDATITPKRGPGRPRKDGSPPQSSQVSGTPGAAGAASKVLHFAEYQGGKTVKKDLTGVINSLVISHAILSARLAMPELKITKDEATQLAEAGSELARHFGIKLNGKNGAVVGMIMAIAVVYGPKAIQAYARLKLLDIEKKKNESQFSST